MNYDTIVRGKLVEYAKNAKIDVAPEEEISNLTNRRFCYRMGQFVYPDNQSCALMITYLIGEECGIKVSTRSWFKKEK